MKKTLIFSLVYILFYTRLAANIPETTSPKDPQTDKVTVQYLKKHLKRSHPRLIVTGKEVRKLRKRIKTDPVTKNHYQAIKLNAEKIRRCKLQRITLISYFRISNSYFSTN